MHTDPLAPLLHHFNADAKLFYAGNVCQAVSHDMASGLGYLHLLRSGRMRLHDASGFAQVLEEPTLFFYARPMAHWFDPDIDVGADLACASVSFDHQSFNPILTALPVRTVLPLAALPASGSLFDLLFAEAFSDRPGRQEVLNRLFEVVLIALLRAHLESGMASVGFLRALSHPQVGRAMQAVHARPDKPWTLCHLAAEASMSRTKFAATFKSVVGSTPGEYVLGWRITVAKGLLRQGVALKQVTERVGYDSQAGFLKAFKGLVGVSPTEWKRTTSTS